MGLKKGVSVGSRPWPWLATFSRCPDPGSAVGVRSQYVWMEYVRMYLVLGR